MQKKVIEVQGIKTCVHVANTKSKETPIVFLHGWGGSAESFFPLAKLVSKKCQNPLYIFDLPGFGESEFPPEKGWDTHDYAKWLDEVLKELFKGTGPQNKSEMTPRVIFYGHSFGCRVIVRYAHEHPKNIEKLILTGAAGIKWPLSLKQKTLRLGAKILKPIFKGVEHKNLEKKGFSGKIRRRVLRLFGAHDWEEADPKLKPTLKKVLEEPDFREELKNITIPTQLIWGARDTYTPLKSAKVYQQYIKKSELLVFPDGRHGIHYTHTKQIATKIEAFILL